MNCGWYLLLISTSYFVYDFVSDIGDLSPHRTSDDYHYPCFTCSHVACQLDFSFFAIFSLPVLEPFSGDK